MNFYNWLQLALVCLIGAMSPGPSLFLIINNTIKKNRLNGIITSIGHGLGVTLYAFLAVYSLGFLIINYSKIFIGFQILGSLFLIFIGFLTIIHAKKNSTDEIKNNKIVSTNSFIQGFLIAFLNPKIFVFFAALFSQFIYNDTNFINKSILILTPGIIDTAWYIIIAFVITTSGINHFINTNKIIIQKFMGVLLILVALTLLYKFI